MHCFLNFIPIAPILPKQKQEQAAFRHRHIVCARGRSTTSGRRGRAAKRSALYGALASYAEHFEPLIAAERIAEQAAAFEVRSSGLSPAQLEDAGVALFGLLLSKPKRPRLYSNAVFALQRPGNQPLSEDARFAAGDLIAIVHNEDDDDIEATVLRRGSRVLEITVPAASTSNRLLAQLQEVRAPVDVFRGASAVVYERALEALKILSEPSSSVTPLMRLIAGSHASREVIDKDTSQRRRRGGTAYFDLVPGIMRIHSGKEASISNAEERARERIRSRYEWESPTFSNMLNNTQIQAIRAAVSRTLTLIHGPPGTGKTRTAAHVVIAALAERRGPVLATAASNTAADALLAAIVAASGASAGAGTGVCIIRVGRVAAVSPHLWRYTLDAFVQRDIEVKRACSRRANAAEIASAEHAAALCAMRKADVVVCTCVSAGRDIVRDTRFPFVLIDEATQATEPDVLIPLACGYADGGPKQLVLAGDHHQLPPTVLADDANEIQISLFSRLWSAGIQSFLLNTQYRMHPNIAMFPSNRFYDRKLRDGITGADRALPAAILDSAMDIGSRVLFVNVQGDEVRGTKREADRPTTGYSYANKMEVHVVAKIVYRLVVEGGFKPESVGVISPYSAQTRLISRKLTPWSAVEVNTVDGFQGREKEAIVISTVRCNSNGDVGFVADWRRLNVAITRSKTLLVVVGSNDTLRNDENWDAWLRWVRRSKGYLLVDGLY